MQEQDAVEELVEPVKDNAEQTAEDIAYLYDCIKRRNNKGFLEFLDRKPFYLNHIDSLGLSFLHHAIREHNYSLVRELRRRNIAPVKKYVLFLEGAVEIVDAPKDVPPPMLCRIFIKRNYNDKYPAYLLPGKEVPNLEQLTVEVNALNLIQRFPQPVSSSIFTSSMIDAYKATQYVFCFKRFVFNITYRDYMHDNRFHSDLLDFPEFGWVHCQNESVNEISERIRNDYLSYFRNRIYEGYNLHHAIESLNEEKNKEKKPLRLYIMIQQM